MERIASFCVDHTKLDRGMYLSRQDGDVLTWDIRMKNPALTERFFLKMYRFQGSKDF